MDTSAFRKRARELQTTCEKLLSLAGEEGRSLTADEQTSYDASFTELEGAIAQIKRADSLADMGADLAQPASASIGPVAATAPEAAPVEVRVGHDRHVARGFSDIGEQLQAIAQAANPEFGHENIDKRLLYLQERGGNPDGEVRVSGASELVASTGGYLVQKDFNDSIAERVYQTGQIASRVTRQEIGPQANGLKFNVIDETSRANGSRWGGVRAYWTAEGAALTSSEPTFAQITMSLNKLTALFYATEELLSDQTSLAGIVERVVPEEIGFQVESAILGGSGSGQPLGISNSASLVSQAKVTSQTADTINSTNVAAMWGRMWPASRANAVWLINQDAESQLTALADAAGNSIYLPPLGLSDTPFSRLFNRPVIVSEHCQTLGDAGDIQLVDLSQYMMIDKGGVRGDSSMHVRFLYDERAFRWQYRCDGQPMWNSALTPANGTATTSPFINLAARA
jgi:HK97 family phage major capsid protein